MFFRATHWYSKQSFTNWHQPGCVTSNVSTRLETQEGWGGGVKRKVAHDLNDSLMLSHTWRSAHFGATCSTSDGHSSCTTAWPSSSTHIPLLLLSKLLRQVPHPLPFHFSYVSTGLLKRFYTLTEMLIFSIVVQILTFLRMSVGSEESTVIHNGLSILFIKHLSLSWRKGREKQQQSLTNYDTRIF